MGQSNMSGRGKDYDASIDGPNDSRIQQWTRANTIATASERLEHADFESQNSRVWEWEPLLDAPTWKIYRRSALFFWFRPRTVGLVS